MPAAVLNTVGKGTQEIESATLEIIIDLEGLRPDPALRPLRQGLEDALLLLCAAPLATIDELARFGRVPASTLRERLEKLAKHGLVDSVSHHLGALGSRPQRRYFPTERGVTAAGAATEGRRHMLGAYPLSRQWFRLLAERLDAVAVLYRVAAMVADADPRRDPVRVDPYRHGPYDLLLTLSGGRTIGLIRQGPALPGSNLRYRLRSVEHLPSGGEALRHPGADPRRPGHPPGHPFPGKPYGAPPDLRSHRGRAAGRRPHRRRLAAVRERPGRGPAGGSRSRRITGGHPGVGGRLAGVVPPVPARQPEAGPRHALSLRCAGRHAGAGSAAGIGPGQPN